MIKNVDNKTSVERDFGSLYDKLGYKLFKMSRFEEYSLYAENRSFLVCDRVITFNDPSGRLMALKPDVTLSIAKNCRDDGGLQKVYYNENVYRIDEGNGEFREIMQSGLECMGELDLYSVCEVLMLAVRSLELISPNTVLDISHMGIISALIEDAGLSSGNAEKALEYFASKNAHGLRALYAECGVSEEKTESAAALARIYGKACDVFPRLEKILPESASSALDELKDVYSLLCEMDAADKIRFDFSIVNDSGYYNGLVFRGFVDGVPRTVLSGGRYDNLLSKFGKNAKAIGFAIYLDALEELEDKNEWDVDTLLIYDGTSTAEQLVRTVKMLTSLGESVRCAREIPEGLRYRKMKKLEKGVIRDVE